MQRRHVFHLFLERMMLKKLKGMKISIEKYTCLEPIPDYFKALNICIEILERRRTDFYFNMIFYKVDTDLVHEMTFDFDAKDDEPFYVKNKQYNVIEAKKYQKLTENWNKIENRDQELLGKLIGKYLSNWWD